MQEQYFSLPGSFTMDFYHKMMREVILDSPLWCSHRMDALQASVLYRD